MVKCFLGLRVVVVLLIVLGALSLSHKTYALAAKDSETSWLEAVVEKLISAPNRQVHITDISGVLSSKATIGEITIADASGVWLRIKNVSLDWNRLALLRGELSINELSAQRIDLYRSPLPTSGSPKPETFEFSLPDLPLAIRVDALAVNELTFGKDLFGLASRVSASGHFQLVDGVLDNKIALHRLDGAGEINLITKFSPKSRELAVDFTGEEQENGILANILQIKNRPAIAFSIVTNGTLDRLHGQLAMQAGKQAVLNGKLTTRSIAGDHIIDAQLNGPIALIVPEDYHEFFGDDTRFRLEARIPKTGGLEINSLTLDGAALKVDLSAMLQSDGFLRRLNIAAKVATDATKSLALPIPGGKTHVDDMQLTVNYGSSDRWNGQFTAKNLVTDQWRAGSVQVDMGGATTDLDNVALRHVGVNVTGNVENISTNNSQLAAALGGAVALSLDGDFNGAAPFHINEGSLKANSFVIWLKGELRQLLFSGNVGLDAENLAPIGLFTGENISGSAHLSLQGTINLVSRAFDVMLAGRTDSVTTSNLALNRLLHDDITLSGKIIRDSKGLAAQHLKLGNESMQLSVDGHFSSIDADMDGALHLKDMALLDNRLTGPLTVKGAARGHNQLIALALRSETEGAKISGRNLGAFSINADTLLDYTSPIRAYLTGLMNGAGLYDGEPLTINSEFAQDKDGLQVKNLLINGRGMNVQGAIQRSEKGLFKGAIHIDAPDIEPLANLLLQAGKGSVHADATFDNDNKQQDLSLVAAVKELSISGQDIESLAVDSKLTNLFKAPTGAGKLSAKGIKIAGFTVEQLSLTATPQDSKTAWQAEAKINSQQTANFSGTITPHDTENWRLTLGQFAFKDGTLAATLNHEANLDIAKSSINIDDLSLAVNDGLLELKGQIGDNFDAVANLQNMPIEIVNYIRPQLQLAGTLSGTIKANGTKEMPQLSFEGSARAVSAAFLREKGLTGFDLFGQGTTKGDQLQIKASALGNGAEVKSIGTIDLIKKTGDIDVHIASLPLKLANGFVKEENFSGLVTGDAHLSGEFTNPIVTFVINGQSLASNQLRASRFAPLTVTSSGEFKDKIINLNKFNLSGAESLALNLQGQIPLAGNGLNVQANGTLPLAMANTFLIERGAKLKGALTIDSTIKGSFAQPILNGQFAVRSGQFIDPTTNVRLNNVVINGDLLGDKIVINEASAASSAGGSLKAEGTISTNLSADLPTNLKVHFNHTRYSDAHMLVATLSGDIGVDGALLRNPMISGKLTVEKAEITIPDNFSNAAEINVKHLYPTRPILTTLKRAGLIETQTRNSGRQVANSGPTLQLQIVAPNQIFVRGKGLDIELGGSIHLTGPFNDIHPVGAFNMIRGRFEILSQRLTFNEGQVTLIGNLNPQLNFSAQTQGSDITVTVQVAGRADDLKITFSSQPQLPQDEVLARLLFNRSIGELSPFQIAQLASAAAELTGVTNTSILNALRANTGLDDLDVVTDAKGNTGVRAGSYIRDNIYLGVEAGSGGSTKGTVNLDISKNVKAKGALGAEGNSSVGVFYESDY